jgi:hypothetical protein
MADLTRFDKSAIVFENVPNPTPPTSSNTIKVFSKNGVLSKIDFSGKITPLNTTEVSYYQTNVEADADMATFTFSVPNPAKQINDIRNELTQLFGADVDRLSGSLDSLATSVEAVEKSLDDKINDNNETVLEILKLIRNNIQTVEDSLETFVKTDEHEVAIRSIKSDLDLFLNSIETRLSEKVNRSELNAAIATVRSAIPAQAIVSVGTVEIGDDPSLDVRKVDNTYFLDIVFPRITQTVQTAKGGGSGTRFLSKLKDVNIQNIQDGQVLAWDSATNTFINVDQTGSGSDITLVAGTNINIIESPDDTFTISATISGGVTTIESSGGSILISEIDGGYNLEVASAPIQNHNDLDGLQGIGGDGGYYHLSEDQYNDYIGKTEVASISGDLQDQIDNIVQESTSIIGGEGISIIESPSDVFTVSVSGDYATNTFVNEVSGNGKIVFR